MIYLAIVLIVLCAAAAIVLIWKGSGGTSFLSAEYGLVLGLSYFIVIPLLLVLFGDLYLQPEFEYSSLPNPLTLSRFSTEYAIVGILILCFFLAVFPRLLGKANKEYCQTGNEYSRVHLNRIFWISSCLHFVALLGLYKATSLMEGGHWYRNRMEFIEQAGAFGPILPHFIFAIRILALSAFFASYLEGAKRIRLKAFILIFLVALDLYVTGNRIFAFQFVMVLGTVLLIRREWRKLILIGVCAIPFGLIMNLFRYVRAVIHDGYFLNSVERGYEFALSYSIDSGFRDFIYGITEGVSLHTLTAIIRNFGVDYSPFWGGTYLRAILFPIPRSLWASKPEGVTVLLGTWYTGGETSLSATIVGEAFLNWGLFSIVFIPLLVIFIRVLCSFTSPIRSLRGMVGLVIGLSVVRMAFADVFISVTFIAAISMLVTMMSRIKIANGLPT